MLSTKIINAYSNIHNQVEYTNNNLVSFDGSQIQWEFFRAWEVIETYYKSNPTSELTFLEVGAWKGLWGIAFGEFCKLHNIKGTYVTLTMIDHDINNRPLFKTVDYLNSIDAEAFIIDENTLSDSALEKVLQYGDKFNMVFIDADHSYDAVKSDISKFAPLATDMILFHDIRPREVRPSFGVYQAILDSNLKLDVEISVNDELMGIGIIYV